MKAMILAAGLGTRLRPLTDIVPKPMVQLAGRPCMEYTLKLLKKYSVLEIAVNIHYKPQLIKNYFGDGSRYGVKLQYSFEDKLMGTAGGFKRLQSFFDKDTALIISGDGLTDIDLQDFYRFHKEKGCIATLALKRVSNPENYGVVELKKDSYIKIFQEKPSREEAVSNLANTGIYLFEPEIFDYIPADNFYDFGKQLFPEFVEKNIDMAGYTMEVYWCDIGNLEVYREANYDLLMGRVKADLPGKRATDNICVGRGVNIHPQSMVKGPVVLGDNCLINEGAEILGPAVLGRNTVVEKEVVLKRSILWDGACIGQRSHLEDSIIGEGVHVDKDSYLKEKVMAGQQGSYPDFAAGGEK